MMLSVNFWADGHPRADWAAWKRTATTKLSYSLMQKTSDFGTTVQILGFAEAFRG